MAIEVVARILGCARRIAIPLICSYPSAFPDRSEDHENAKVANFRGSATFWQKQELGLGLLPAS